LTCPTKAASSGATCTTTCTLTNSGVTSAVAGTNINVSAATGAVTFGITGQIAAANGGTGVASPTANTIPINNGASAQTNTGVGLTGQYVGGVTSSAPAYKSGPWTLLNTLTASNSASLSDTTSITSAYSEYEIVFQNILPATNAVDCRLRVNSGGVQTASYLGSVFFGNQSGISSTPSAPTTSVLCSGGLAHIQNSGTGLSGTCNVQNPSQTSAPKMWNCSTGYPSSVGSIENIMGAVYWNGGNGAITGIEVSMSSGNIASGTVKIYGRL
jgi:hypothetical protein